MTKARPLGSLGVAILACLSMLLVADAGLAQNTATSYDQRLSRFELYGEYSYLHPQSANIYGPNEPALTTGGAAGINYYFTRHIGVEAEGGFNKQGNNYHCMFTGQAGVVGRTQMRRFSPFVHALGGESKVAGPDVQTCKAGWGLTGGLGIDYIVPGLGGHLALRPIQADYEFNHIVYGPAGAPILGVGGTLKENAYRLSAGVVFRLGDKNGTGGVPTSMSCDATPGDVYPGEPVTVSARTLDARSRKASFSWSTSGGQLSSHGDTVVIETTGLAPGSYVVSGRMTRGARGKFAECTARFDIRDRNARQIVVNDQPPAANGERQLQQQGAQVQQATPSEQASSAVSCFATPAAVFPGASATITTNVPAAVIRPLTYTYTATQGVITGNGPTATFSAPGMVGTTATITCNVADAQGGSASATTTVQVLQPETPTVDPTQVRTLCTLSFDRDRARPARVDNAAKACLDDIALSLQREPGSTLTMAGSYDPGERPVVGSQRAANAKAYLQEKGIDGSRIQVSNAGRQGRLVLNTQIPSGATYDPGNGATFDETPIATPNQPYAATGGAVRYTGRSRPPAATRRIVRRRVTRRAVRRPVRRRVVRRPATPAPRPEPVPNIILPTVPTPRLRDYQPPPQLNQQQILQYPVPQNNSTIPLPQGNQGDR